MLLDFGIFLGKFLNWNNSLQYLLDTQVSDSDLKNSNIILIGNTKTNSVSHALNSHFPIYFDDQKDFIIKSKLTGQSYNYDYDAVILKMKNPLNDDKSLMLIAGKRSSGLATAILAIKNNISEILRGNDGNKGIIARVVSGLDKNSDGIIDSVKFLE